MMPTFGSLFSGIGGMDLGLERAGFECRWQVEIDPFCQRVLAKHWPDVKRYGDVRMVGEELEPVDLICGGFPCQPHSVAGARRASEDERDLWPEFARLIRLLKPRGVLAENVRGLLSSEDGRFFGRVLRDLAERGYDAEWSVLRAADVGAPHQRARVFLLAHNSGDRIQGMLEEPFPRFPGFSWCENVRGVEDLRNRPGVPEPLLWGSRNGFPDYVDRIKALGNSVVPQVAEAIGQRIFEVMYG